VPDQKRGARSLEWSSSLCGPLAILRQQQSLPCIDSHLGLFLSPVASAYDLADAEGTALGKGLP
jgi:hypothetical protein